MNPADTPPRALYLNLRGGAEPFAPRPALSFAKPNGDVRTYSFDEFFTTVEVLAERLPEALPSGPIGILLDDQEDQVLHYMAMLAMGRVPAILTPPHRKLDPDYYATTTRAVLAHVKFGALVTDTAGLEAAAPATIEPGTGRVRRGEGEHTDCPPDERLEGLAFVQFSSGTTGIKKGVGVTPDAALAQVRAYAAAIELSPDDSIVSWLPLYHDMGFITALHLPLAYGAHTIMLNPLQWVGSPRSYPALVTRFRATLGWHPNFALQFMSDRVREVDAYDLSSLRGVVNCSEPVTAQAQTSFAERFKPAGLREGVFWGCYAMAETTFAVTHGIATDSCNLDPAGPKRRTRIPLPAVSVGRPLDGVSLDIQDANGEPVGDREIGDIVVSAPFLASGYFDNPGATTEVFSNSTYRTGDIGYRLGEDFYVTGRRKDVIITAGVNMHPGDIEAIVSAQPGIQPGRVVAFAVFDDRAQTERVFVLFEPADDDLVNTATIRQRLITTLGLANFEVRSVPQGWLVKSSSGKMARAVNRDKWLSERAGARAG